MVIDWQHDFVHFVLVVLTVLMAAGVAKDLAVMAWRRGRRPPSP